MLTSSASRQTAGRRSFSLVNILNTSKERFSMPKAFITGVGGFVGPYLVRHLAASGFEVFGIDRKGSKVDGCTVESCDVTDAEKLSAVVNKVKPDFIFHLAGQSSVGRRSEE